MSGTLQPSEKFRAAIDVLNRVRESLLDSMAETVLEQEEEFSQGGFQVNEFLEVHGSRLHFLCLMISQFELAAESQAEARRDASSSPSEEPGRAREANGRSAGEESTTSHSEEAGNDG